MALQAGQVAETRMLLQRIVEADDVVLRNRLITRCYRDIAVEVSAVVGDDDLNWFWFGTWASGTAGAAIRGEGLPLDLGTSRAVAAGNLAIIVDVAPPVLRWLDEIAADGGPSTESLQRTLEDPLFADAPLLTEAIRCYHAAAVARAVEAAEGEIDEAIDKAAAELVLLGNALMGAHEQEVVDEFIDRAMPLGCLFGLVTTRFVAIRTPDGPLDVCRDVVAPGYLAPDLFPPSLAELQHPELCALFTRFGQSTALDVRASNALRWEDYDDRMGFIVTFFRAYQRDVRFYEVPVEFVG